MATPNQPEKHATQTSVSNPEAIGAVDGDVIGADDQWVEPGAGVPSPRAESPAGEVGVGA